MIVLKCIIQKGHNLKLIISIKTFLGGLDNDLTFECYNRSIASNIKNKSTLLNIVNKNLCLSKIETTYIGMTSF